MPTNDRHIKISYEKAGNSERAHTQTLVSQSTSPSSFRDLPDSREENKELSSPRPVTH